MLLDDGLDALFEGHFGVGAGAASALQLHEDDVVSGEFHEFDVAAVGLEVGAELVDNCFHFLF